MTLSSHVLKPPQGGGCTTSLGSLARSEKVIYQFGPSCFALYPPPLVLPPGTTVNILALSSWRSHKYRCWRTGIRCDASWCWTVLKNILTREKSYRWTDNGGCTTEKYSQYSQWVGINNLVSGGNEARPWPQLVFYSECQITKFCEFSSQFKW